MIFTPLEIEGAYRLELEKHSDQRGFFSRVWCRNEFEEHGLVSEVVQANLSHTRVKGTIRGLHFQKHPHGETKLIQCTLGAIFDVIVDLRPDSPTYMRWLSEELSGENYKMVYVPKGCAHGFQSLADNTEVYYLVSAFYAPEAEGGVRYDDPAFEIDWPLPVTDISEKDRNWPDYQYQ